MNKFAKNLSQNWHALLLMMKNNRDGRYWITVENGDLMRSFIALALAIICYSLMDYYNFDFEIKMDNIPAETSLKTYVTANFFITVFGILLSVFLIGVLALIFGFQKNFWHYITAGNWLMAFSVPLIFIVGLHWDFGNSDEFTLFAFFVSTLIITLFIILIVADFQVLRFTLDLNILQATAIWLFVSLCDLYLFYSISDWYGISTPLE